MDKTKENGVKYSIIVPVYNPGRHLIKCLDSLFGQTYKNIEIIAVNDGSTDDSMDILNDYKRRFKNFLVFSQDNIGVVAARELGLKNATGTYCLMMDSDDWLRSDAIEKINRRLSEYGDLDVLKFRFEYSPSGRQAPIYELSDRILNNNELCKVRKDLILTSKYNNLSNQVFKISLYHLVEDMHNERIDYGEDLMVNLDILGRSKQIVFINDVLYYYNHENQNSTTHRIGLKKLSKDISNSICVSKKRERYLKVFDINDIAHDTVKWQTVVFACRHIKDYILATRKNDSSSLLNSVIKSGLYDYWDGVIAPKATFFQRIICKCIKKKDFNFLYLIKPLFILRAFLRKIVDGPHI